MRRVIVEVRSGGVAVHGLSETEEDELFERLELKFGNEVNATVGVPYVVSVIGVDASVIQSFISDIYRQRGWQVGS